jgi:hypothetical protein
METLSAPSKEEKPWMAALEARRVSPARRLSLALRSSQPSFLRQAKFYLETDASLAQDLSNTSTDSATESETIASQ